MSQLSLVLKFLSASLALQETALAPHFHLATTAHVEALSRAMKRLTGCVGIEDATAHDFRRTGATNITGERIAIPRFIVSRVLNHVSDTGDSAVVTGVYDRNAYLAEKRRALSAWAALLQEIVEERAPSNGARRSASEI